MLLNKVGYDPVDDDSDSGYRRPPREPKAINDYFHVLGEIEDEGDFAAEEMAVLLADPASFFSALCPACKEPHSKHASWTLKQGVRTVAVYGLGQKRAVIATCISNSFLP